MPVQHAVDEGTIRFHEAAARLPSITYRVLELTLKDLRFSAVVCRMVRDDYPSIPLYAATGKG